MQHEEKKVQLKRKKRKKSIFGYLVLFVAVFFLALFGMSFLVKSYSPSVDVTIGNNESLTLNEVETDVEMKPIDERLKWIQLEDEMPSVAIRENDSSKGSELNSKKQADIDKVQEEPIIKAPTPPKPDMAEIAKESHSSRTETKKVVLPAPIPSLTKVYLGTFSSVDEAMAMQNKVSKDVPEAMPFVKNKDGYYIVQLGSFSNKTIAETFMKKVANLGYKPRMYNED